MSPNKTLEQLIAMIVEAEERGQAVDRAKLCCDYPQFADELQDFLLIHERFVAAIAIGQQSPSATPQMAPESQETLQALLHSPTQAGSSESNPPKIFGDYEIIQEIDRGGMGVVYQARHRHLGRIVALKLIRSGELASQEEVQRFRSEAEAAAALKHPGIIPIHEVGMLHGLVYFTMPYIGGESLATRVAEGPLEPAEAARIVFKLCQAIEHAHRAGVFHRDLKPANVLIDEHGQPIIIDFGLAKITHHDQRLTYTGQLLGTPAYMPPEHASGRASEVTAAFDVYSLGAILYTLCAGQPPFSGPTPFDVLMQVLDRDPPNPSKLNRQVNHELDYICRRALEKDPAARYQHAGELADDLQLVLRGEPLDCPRTSLLGRMESWWRREPILVSHVCGIGATTVIVAISHAFGDPESTAHPIRMGLLLSWLVACFCLQFWVVRARWRDAACLSWAAVDVIIYTTLIAFADPPRSMLLIGYPMLIVASSLFYRQRFVLVMTGLCCFGFAVLGWLVPRDDFVRLDFAAIFLVGLAVIGLSLLAVIRRVRSLTLFCEP